VAYSSESRLLLLEIDLPEAKQAIPKVKAYKYTKSTDLISETYITDKNYRESYSNLIAQIALRTLYEAFIGINNKYVDTIVLNCKIQTIDPATGTKIYPCLLSTRTTHTKIASIDLKHVDPALCLKEIKAIISSSPSELLPVRPVLEFDMNDPRFIAEQDILSGLDARPNLMDLDPSEFESLITNLFQLMGLETKLTQASRDGGVDCVAYDPRPILGGKVVIQAKRYKNTVGVSAVRDLFGTLQNEGASKGILVTTSGYGKASYDFANGKPIELLDGNNLLFLLKEHADIDARIIMPLD
jgi:restriction system protein